jgi:hypothetical protein
MPAWWRNMTVECRHKFLSVSKGLMEEAAKKGQSMWCVKQHVIRLTEFGPADKIFQMRACFMAAQKHPEVICYIDNTGVSSDDEDDDTNQPKSKGKDNSPTCLETFTLKPARLVHAAKTKPTRHNQMKLFEHMTNFCARQNAKVGTLKPSSALDVEFTQDQATLLQPTMMQCNTGVIMDEMRGDGAKKRMARRRLDMVNGNISSYCRVLNSKDQLDHMKEVTLLTASVAEVTKEKEADRQRRMDKRKQDSADRTKKDAERKATAERKAIESKPKCAALMDEISDKGRDHVKKLTVGQLKMLLQYEFNSTAANGKKKDECIAAVMLSIEANDSRTEV